MYILLLNEIQYNLSVFLTNVGRQTEPCNPRVLLCSYQHIQHGVSMLIFNMVSELPSCGHGFLSLRYIQEQSLSSSMFFHCVHLLWLPTAAVKTLRYSQATVRSRINTARSLSSSNYRHRAKFYSMDLLNLIKSQDFIKSPS